MNEGTGFPKIALAAWVRDGKKDQFFSVKASPIQTKKKEEKDDIPSSMIERTAKGYTKAKSYDVVVEVKYRRTRKVKLLMWIKQRSLLFNVRETWLRKDTKS